MMVHDPQIWHGVYRAGYDAALDALRAKVEALPNEWNDFVRRADVLALFDGDDQ